MKAALITLLLIVTTVTQPLLAAPAACRMPSPHKAVACASCCAAMPCCIVSERENATPVSAEATFPADPLGALPAQPLALLAMLDQPRDDRSFLPLSRVAHSPPPLALSCIQLI